MEADPAPREKVHAAIALVDAANAEDPSVVLTPEGPQPEALVYGQRMSAWLARLRPDASEALRIAVRAQHIRRWQIPRATYPEGRTGYLKWRSDLGKFHADQAAALMAEAGYESEEIERVRFLLRKQRLSTDSDSASLEDAACLVFLEHYAADFAARHEHDKVVDILRKTWKKMSSNGKAHAQAQVLQFPPRVQALLGEALAQQNGQ